MRHAVEVVDCSGVIAFSSEEAVVFHREWNVEFGVLGCSWNFGR